MGTTHARLAVELSRVSSEDIGRIGVKAANQASLLQAGFPVPDGVVLTTDAYRSFVASWAGAPEAKTAPELPLDLRDLLGEIAETLGDSPLAVRSSGVAEDLPDASFAGQYETVLDVRGLDELEEAVRRCWASAASTHASAYREAHGLNASSMAVLIQQMVNAEAAGVASSANPVTGRRGDVVINAVPGLRDKPPSGQMSPDQWLVRDEEVRREASSHNAIDADQARAIAATARRVEAHFGSPQDIEWVIAEGRLHLLQARPITSLPEPGVEPIPVEVEIPPGFWFFDGSHGNSHVPMDRFLLKLVRPCSARWSEEFGYLFDGIEFREIGGWAYQRMVPLGDRQAPDLPVWLMRILVRTVPMLRRRVARAIEATRSDLPGRFIDRWYAQWQPEMAASIAELRAVELSELSDGQLRRHIAQTRELMSTGVLIHMRLHGAMAPILRELVHACEDLLGWDMTQAMELVSGTSYKSTEPARRLRELADLADNRPGVRQVLKDPGEDPVAALTEIDGEFVTRFTAYLREYGCRALGHTTVGEATLAEAPALVLSMIAGQLERGYDPDHDRQGSARRRSDMLRRAENLLTDRPDDLRRLHEVVARAQRAYPVREDNEFFCFSSPLALVRYAVLELGRRLARRGVIEAADDVLFLELGEALGALGEQADLEELVRRRKGQQAWIERHPGPPSYGTPPPGPPSFEFLPPDARPLMESMLWNNEVIMAVGGRSREAESPGSTLAGLTASAGAYTGPVRVVMDESEFDRIRPGDVLVCPATSPVWSVVFPIIGALVTDTGGLLSHPAIIAREYGIPAVVATGDATTRLHDGALVTVNGTTGTVEWDAPATATRHDPLQKER